FTPQTLRAGQAAPIVSVVSPSVPDPSYRAPDTDTHPLSELEPLCRAGLLKLERTLLNRATLPAEAERALFEVRRFIDSVALAGEAVRADQAGIAQLELRSSEMKANFGRALDELGHDHSRANALVTDLDARIAKLQTLRDGDIAAQPGQRDAWLWEQGA